MEKFTVWIVEELNKRDWNPADLAKKARMSTGALSNIMNGKRKPGPEICRAIASALSEPPEHVFRMAGLLPPLPASNDGPTLNELVEIMKRLPDGEREQVLNYARMRYKNQQDKDKGKPPKPITLTVPTPRPVIEHIPSIPKDIPPETVAKVRAMMERLTPKERAKLIDHLLARRDFVETLRLRGIEIPPQHHRQVQKASNRKDQE